MHDLPVPLGLRSLQPDDATQLDLRVVNELSAEVVARSTDGRPGVTIEVDLGDAVAYWHPGQRDSRALPPDWAPPTVTSLVHSAPVGALYTASGEVLVGWAAAESVAELAVHFGVSEERKSFVIHLKPVSPSNDPLILTVDRRGGQLTEVTARLARWLSDRCAGTVAVPDPLSREPVYSTWYTFAQDINSDVVVNEAHRAVELGCGSVFIDDGWQRLGRDRGYQGCGDWLPDQGKFFDLAGTVEQIHRSGASVALWVAPLLLGEHSDAFPALYPFAPHRESDLNCQVLDPRYRQVREHVARTCLRLVVDYNVDLLKIDFLDQAMAYRDRPCGGDIASVGEAMAAMLSDIRKRLRNSGRDHVVFEFRQPYVSPAIARYGEILRANDCPGDSLVNRIATVDARLISVGQVVHADPMMWGSSTTQQGVAQQLYAGWFAVPQISMRLETLSPEQMRTLRSLLALWRSLRDVTLDGSLSVVGAERGYDLVAAVREDIGRCVTVRYSPLLVDLDEYPTREVVMINATATQGMVVHSSDRQFAATIHGADGDLVPGPGDVGPGLFTIPVPALDTLPS